MHREDDSDYLLYIEPALKDKSLAPVEDELVWMIEKALENSKPGAAMYSDTGERKGKIDLNSGYKGWHTTSCGEHSSNRDYLLENGMITNSLAPFYLRWYRAAIPATEMKKVEKLRAFYEAQRT